MGKYFVMSMRFNKCNASDFGFVSKDSNTAINPKDNSTWIKAALFDFGWGKENGFYKAPLPSFEFLFELALHSTNPINRCSIDNKTCDQIQDDSTRWMKVSDIANRI